MRAVLRDVERRKIALPGRGVEIALLDWGGDGPLAFLHHANGFCAALWDLVAERLRPHYRVIALDARGHGDSSSPPPPAPYHWENFIGDLIAVVERVLTDLGRARVDYGIGHSFGGTTTAMAAARRPELYARVECLAGLQRDRFVRERIRRYRPCRSRIGPRSRFGCAPARRDGPGGRELRVHLLRRPRSGSPR
jgi:pimeloyl-ACP methyl ester carboxylesterase